MDDARGCMSVCARFFAFVYVCACVCVCCPQTVCMTAQKADGDRGGCLLGHEDKCSY